MNSIWNFLFKELLKTLNYYLQALNHLVNPSVNP
jgi:hypothetical protein